MFFPEKIAGINSNDYVLEIGPGGTPHPRSDVFLELEFDNEKSAEAQRGFTPKLKTNKKIVYYNGGRFPFQDKEFDYVICSHVLEHVSEIEEFLAEMFRVAEKGYLEYPLIYYDFIYNFPEHLTFLKFNEDKLFYLPKSKTSLSEFSAVNSFFYESLKQGHNCLVDALLNELFEGFEWDEPFHVERAEKIRDVCWRNTAIDFTGKPKSSLLAKTRNAIKTILS